MSSQLPLDELSLVFARLKGLLLTEEKVDRAVQLLAEAARDAIPGTSGAGVSLLNDQGRRTSQGATDAIVEQADVAQYELGEGPCLTAWASDETGRDSPSTAPAGSLWNGKIWERKKQCRNSSGSPARTNHRCIGCLRILFKPHQPAGSPDRGEGGRMQFGNPEKQQAKLLHAAMHQAGISTGDLWLRYFSLGGSAGEYETDAYVQGIFPLPEVQRDLLAQAANELIDELPPPPRAPYSEDFLPGGARGPLQSDRRNYPPA
jgi:hypothetical protein